MASVVSPPLNATLIQVKAEDITSHKGLIAVIPAYNEQITLGSVILQARRYVDRVIVVDDNSSDKTPEIAKIAGAEVISLHVHTGRAYALLLGLRHARELGCRAAVYIGTDGYTHLHDIPKITARTLSGEADLVIGSHYLENSGDVPVNQKIKKTIHRFSEKSEENSRFTDPLSNIRSFSRKALDKLDFPTDGYNIEADIIAHFLSLNYVIDEIPLTNVSKDTTDPNWENSVKILAAMPAFNEEKFIAKTIVGAKKYVDKVLVVDDGSTDATKKIAEELGAVVVRHEKNAGYGASLQTIFTTARELHVEALVILDADGQHDPQDVGRLLEALVKCNVDVVIGSRFLREDDKQIPGYRKVGMKVLDGATRLAGVADISDSQSGFRVYGKKAIDVIHLSGEGMSAGSEILIRISDNKLKIAEVPINVRYDIEDTSSINPFHHGLSVLSKIIGLISYRKPLQSFGIPGGFLIIGGMIAEIWTFAEVYAGQGSFHYILAIGSAFSMIFGMLLVSVGLILNYLVKFVREQKK